MSTTRLLHPGVLRFASLLPALLVMLPLAAEATVYVEARSSSLAQAGPQPYSSNAQVVNGVVDPGSNWAGPGGTSNTGGGPFNHWADTTQIYPPVLATTYAAADLGNGSLRVYAEAGVGVSNAVGYARWIDTITFNNRSGQTLELDFSWQTEGSITAMNGDSWRTVTSSIVLGKNYQNFSFIGLKGTSGYTDLGGAQYQYYASVISPAGGGFFTYQPRGNNDDGAWRTALTGPASGSIAATLLIPPGLASIDIDALLSVDCRSGAICDFGHTATFAFGALPAGLSWTSESGVFLSAPVPEPGSWALMAVGSLLLTAFAATKQRHARGDLQV